METGNLYTLAPEISGLTAKDSLKTLVNVKIYPHLLILSAATILFLIAAVLLITDIIPSVIKGEFGYESLYALILPAVLYVLHQILFNVENRKAKQSLKEMFEAEIIK